MNSLLLLQTKLCELQGNSVFLVSMLTANLQLNKIFLNIRFDISNKLK